ncbi:DedA family protein [Olivibacter sitiensis]|uniref:DedA family protein n=1 Tax=Olivibacter sitiensis TaxID=376470 RepID=UPI0004248B97|nr:DedA family protein [Olivibacter sitiensis]
MDFLSSIIDFILHIDRHLDEIVTSYQTWTYVVLFLIIFAETGFVVTPFLPGDSLLFATGAIIASDNNNLELWLMWLILIAAAFLGDWANYHIGQYIGPKAFSGKYRFLKKEYLSKTEAFYEKHGGKTVIYARFVPIVRTFAPFVAGIGTMSYSKFASYNIIGALLWVSSFLVIGYFFGNIPVVKTNFTLVVFAIILLSVIPPFIEVIRSKREGKK